MSQRNRNLQGVTVCLLTAISLLALLGLRHPVKLRPLLLFETIWKLLWLGLVALPQGRHRGSSTTPQPTSRSAAPSSS